MTVLELMSRGGALMWPIYVASIVALAVFFEKLWEVQVARRAESSWLTTVSTAVEAQDWEAAACACEHPSHPAAPAVRALVQTLRSDPSRAEAEARRVGSLTLQSLERRLGVLAFIAEVTPLLGLLGTVAGMVQLFAGLESAGLVDVNVQVLASGIWQALLTTAAGLLVAVPALAAHSYLASAVDGIRLELSDAIERLLTRAGGSSGAV